MTTKRTDIELIGPSVATATDPVERHELPGLKRIRINGIEVTANKITIDGDSERDGRLVAVTARLFPSSLRFITAAEADNTEPGLIVEQVTATLTEALTIANARVKELERQLDAHHRHDAATDADAVRARAAERILAYAAEEKTRVNDTYGQVYLSGLETAAALIVDGEDDGARADIDTDSPFLPAPQARAEAHLIKVALNHIDEGHDPRGVLHFNDRPLARRVVDTIMRERRRDDAELTTADDVRAAAAARIRSAADLAEQAIAVTPADGEVDSAAADAFVAGLRAAEQLAVDQAPEADPNVAHIDTVNGRTAYTPGPFAEAILTNGGTIVVDDNGEPHITEMTIGNDPAPKPGTLITADGKRHRFASGTLEPLADDRNVGTQVKHPDQLGEDTDTDER